MKQNAIVLEIKKDKALVEVERVSACAGCSENEHCIACKKKLRVYAENVIGAAAGDNVVIESPSKNILSYALFVFVLPILLAFAAFVVCSRVGTSETVALIACVCVFSVSFLIIPHVLNKKAKENNKFVIIGRQ